MKIHERHYKITLFRIFSDLIMAALSWLLSFQIRFTSGFIDVTKGMDTFSNYAKLIPHLMMVYLFTFLTMGLYRAPFTNPSFKNHIWDMVKALIFSFLYYVVTVYFVFEHRYSRITFLLFFTLTFALIPLGRLIIQRILKRYQNIFEPLRAIAWSSTDVAQSFQLVLNQIQEHWPVELQGLHTLPSNPPYPNLMPHNYDVILIGSHSVQGDEWMHLQNQLEKFLGDIYIIPLDIKYRFFSPKFYLFDNKMILHLNSFALGGYGTLFKRWFDIVFSLTFMILFSPLFIFIAALVKVTSKGPIIYKQERMGLDGKVFWCLKFRGMRQDAESQTGPVWAQSGDNRTTLLGKFLRKTSLDEIPQFFNVLKGEMSIVGPRPERPVFVDQFQNHIPGYMLRHKVKAGITGWAQIQGWRGNTSLERRIECDLWYMQNWSLWLDVKICLLTPFKGFFNKNAY